MSLFLFFEIISYFSSLGYNFSMWRTSKKFLHKTYVSRRAFYSRKKFVLFIFILQIVFNIFATEKPYRLSVCLHYPIVSIVFDPLGWYISIFLHNTSIQNHCIYIYHPDRSTNLLGLIRKVSIAITITYFANEPISFRYLYN